MKNLTHFDIDKLDDSLPTRSKIGRIHQYRHYGKNYAWNKVRRFLLSRLGKHWDAVYSEYVNLEWIPKEYRNKEKINQSVIVDTFMKDDKVYFYLNGRNYIQFGPSSGVLNEHPIEDVQTFGNYKFYIHPKTKCLQLVKSKQNKHKVDQEKTESNKRANFRIVGDYHQLYKENGIWFEFIGKPVPFNRTYVFVGGEMVYVNKPWINPIGPRDMMMDKNNVGNRIFGRHVSHWQKDSGSVELISRHQLSKKKLRKYGLKNDKPVVKKPCVHCGDENCTRYGHSEEKNENSFY